MIFWLLNPWDAVPGEVGFERGAQVAAALSAAGHEVVWWQTGYAHAEKKTRADRLTTRMLGPSQQLVLLPARPYTSNISGRRLLSIADYVREFARAASRHPRPDAVLVSGPIFFSEPVLLYLRHIKGIPLVYEFRDLWPETIINNARGSRRWLRQLAFLPFRALRRLVFRSCDGIIGLNRTYLDIARREAGEKPGLLTAVAYPSPAARCPGASRLVKPPGQIWVISSGTLGASHDHATLLAAAGALKARRPEIRFLITGTGPLAAAIQEEISAKELHNVDLLGALPLAEFQALLSLCDVGLALYRQFSPVVFPTKIVDYMMAGLAIITSAQGEGAAILGSADAGHAIPPEDPAALAAVLEACVAVPHRMAELKANSARLALDFTQDRQIQVIVDMLVAAGGRDSPASAAAV